MKYCSSCGQPLVFTTPPGDSRERFVCRHCDTVHYQNPRVITGCLVSWQDQVLLCRRDIDPRSGYWTLPAGFLENGETAQAGAIRETWEEARARVVVEDLYTLFSLPHISQIYMFYRGRLETPVFDAGEETREVALFREDEIPWDELAFPVIRETLLHYFQDRVENHFPVRAKDIIVDRNRQRR